MTIDTIEKAEDFVKNLKRSDNWVSNEELLNKLNESYKIILEVARKYAEKFENYDCLLNAISLQFRVQLYLGNLEKTQEILNEQLSIAINFNNSFQLQSAYINRAFQYHLLQKKEDCIESFEHAIKHILKSKDNYYIAMTYINYAGYLMEFKEYKKAKERVLFKNCKFFKNTDRTIEDMLIYNLELTEHSFNRIFS